MAITQAQILKYSFAEKGDKREIPADANIKGLMSWEQGFTLQYSLDPEKDGYYIPREQFNQMMFEISQAVRNLQINGGHLWDNDSANLIGGHPAGARVMVRYDLSTNQIIEQDLSSTVSGLVMSSTIPLVSMKDKNLTSPFATNALFKDWWIDDGVSLFGIKLSTQNPTATAYKVPSGYLDFGGDPATEYPYENYPRVKYFKDKGGAMPSYITDGGTYFKLVDVRGRFPRIFSNGGSIDSGRGFSTLQGDAIRNISGRFSFRGETNQGVSPVGIVRAEGAFGKEGDNTQWGVGFGHKFAGQFIVNFNASSQVSTASENRPNNLNLKYFIKV